MTEENKPSWQYVPPTSVTASGIVDATKYMKGGPPRRSASSETPVQNTSRVEVSTSDPSNTTPCECAATEEVASSAEAPASASSTTEPASTDSPVTSESSSSSDTEHSFRHEGGYRRENRYASREPRREGRREGRWENRDARQRSEFRPRSERYANRTGTSSEASATTEAPKKGFRAWVRRQVNSIKSLFGAKKEASRPQFNSDRPSREFRSDRREGGRRYRGGHGRGHGRGGDFRRRDGGESR
jgi:hypothetical protein